MTDIILSKKDLNIRLYNIIKGGGNRLLFQLNDNSIYNINDNYEIKENNFIIFNLYNKLNQFLQINNFTRLILHIYNNNGEKIPIIHVYIKNNTLINVIDFIDNIHYPHFTHFIIFDIYDIDFKKDKIEKNNIYIEKNESDNLRNYRFTRSDTLKINK